MESVNSTSFRFEWEPPLNSSIDEDIHVHSYLLECEPPPSQLQFPIAFPVASLDSNEDGTFFVTLSGFVPGTLYKCTLLAVNSGGKGDAVLNSGFTDEEGINFFSAQQVIHIGFGTKMTKHNAVQVSIPHSFR